MQSALQHADPQSDPHDDIAALLGNQAPRTANDPSELNITPVDRGTSAASPAPSIEPPSRAAPLNDNAGDIREPTPRARPGRRIARILLSVCAGIAATIAWQTYGEQARQRLSHLAPQLLASAPARTPSANAAESQDAASQVGEPQTAAEVAPVEAAAAAAVPSTPVQPATAAAAPAAETALVQATLPPELAQSIESIAREVSALKQTVEQLKAGQQQLSRDITRAAEQEARRKLPTQTSKPAPPPQSPRPPTPPPYAAAAPRNTVPYSPPPTNPQGQAYPQGSAQREVYISAPAPTTPARLPPEPGFVNAPRPPMPLQ